MFLALTVVRKQLLGPHLDEKWCSIKVYLRDFHLSLALGLADWKVRTSGEVICQELVLGLHSNYKIMQMVDARMDLTRSIRCGKQRHVLLVNVEKVKHGLKYRLSKRCVMRGRTNGRCAEISNLLTA